MGRWRDIADGVFDASLARHMPTRRWGGELRLQYALRRQLGELVRSPRVRLEFDPKITCGHEAEISRTGEGFLFRTAEVSSLNNWLIACNYGIAYLYWLSRCPPEVGPITGTLGDGDSPSTARFAFSTHRDDVVPVPDPYFLKQRAFASWRRLGEFADSGWALRNDEIVWRGSTTSFGSYDPRVPPAMRSQRLALCLALRGVAGTDVKYSAVMGNDATVEYLARHGIGGEPIAERSWLGRKFAFDIDGNTNTWSNLIIRLHLGCCVLKVASRFGYRQWYYDRLKPWEHYVPVAADLSDLMERIEWVRTNDREAAEIARRGQAFARTLTWEAVEAEVVELITANWNRPQPG